MTLFIMVLPKKHRQRTAAG